MRFKRYRGSAITLALATGAMQPVAAQDAATIAQAFGARDQVQQISLSPDGKKVAIIAPFGTRGEALMIADPFNGGTPVTILRTNGEREQLDSCSWVTTARLACRVYFTETVDGDLLGFSRMIALGADGKLIKVLSARTNSRSLGFTQNGGSIIDWTGGGEGNVLMTRDFVPENTTGTHIASTADGYGVERVDTLGLSRRPIEAGRPMAVEYITDGHGTVRIMGVRSGSPETPGNTINYFYRRANSRDWATLSALPMGGNRAGFNPYAVDPALDVAYGFDQQDGRQALFRIALDGSLRRELVLARPDVDVDSLVRIGRQHRVVGVSYATERRQVEFFDPALKSLGAALERALPNHPNVSFVDASEDEQSLLLFAGSDTVPGSFYVLDRRTRHMTEVLPLRPELATIPLGTMQAITYTAADGTRIPAYLTLPAGSNGKNLPAIVMPHGGPGARDEWGFDWWAQFFAARGFAVLQPNFRGSAGYGASWYRQNGFRSWRTAIGDVNDAGRWLTAQGIANPAKLAVVGWSYGGYAALQSSALDPALFKAIVAVAPVTDLDMLREESAGFSNHALVDAFIGHGPHITEGSPTHNVAAIRVPVLMFHGDKDQNVGIAESRAMARRLRDAGKSVQLVEYPGLSHQLDDSRARADMLGKTDAFLRGSLGL